MKRNKINFYLDALIFLLFTVASGTGFLLHRTPRALEGKVLSLSRAEWGSVHWGICVLFIISVAAHIALHWKWSKVNSKKYLRAGPVLLAVCGTGLFLIIGFIIPVLLTTKFRNLHDSRNIHIQQDVFSSNDK